MKLLFESWRGYLKEIGEASLEPYDFNQVLLPLVFQKI